MNDKSVEKLLNQLYSEVDLKSDIFNFIQPVLMKSYALLQSDKLNIQNGQTDNVLFKDIEQQHVLENIIYRDLPGLVDIYIKLPIEYRNTQKLKNGKTHRAMLIENVEILINKLKEVEKTAYMDIDQAMTVKNKLIKEKYVQDKDNFIELNKNQFESNIDKISSQYEYEKADSVNNTKYVFNYHDLHAMKNNQKIVLDQGTLKYKAKDKMQSLLSSLMNVSKKGLVATNNALKPTFRWFKKEGFEAIANVVAFTIVAAIFTSPITGFIGVQWYSITQESVARNMVEVGQILNANKNMQDISMMTLQKFAKENDLDLKSKNKNEIIVTQNASSSKCEKTFAYINNVAQTDKTIWHFKVNNRAFSSNDHISSKNVETICDHNTNKISAVFTNL